VLDPRDSVFVELRLWRDANGDGISQASELASLLEHGVLSITLDGDRAVERGEKGAISAKLEVQTNRGARHAYDVWFYMKLSAGNLPALEPGG
jgi:hypothetical protein